MDYGDETTTSGGPQRDGKEGCLELILILWLPIIIIMLEAIR